MRAPLPRACDWSYILLADSQRSPVPVMFEKQSGSPVRFRTYDPLVYSPGVNCFVFSVQVSWPSAFRRYESSVRSAKHGLCTANQLCVSLHISATATGNARLCVAAVVRAALRHERIFPRVCAIRSESCGTGVPELWAAAIRRLGMRVTIPMRRGESAHRVPER